MIDRLKSSKVDGQSKETGITNVSSEKYFD